MAYRIPRADLCMSDAMPFSQHWEARVPVPIEEVGDLGEALSPAYTALRPGDLVNVCSFTKNDWARLAEIASFRIVKRDNVRVYAIQVGETVKVSEDRVSEKIDEVVELEVVKVGNSFEVRDKRTTATIEVFVSQKQADEFKQREEAKGSPKVKKSIGKKAA